jgi:hypothetical protein
MYTLHHRKPGRATPSTNKKKGKGHKQVLIGQKVLEIGGLELLILLVSTLPKNGN